MKTEELEMTQKTALCREKVAQLAHIASGLDYDKSLFADAFDRLAISLAVGILHRLAMAHDQAGGYGVYAGEDHEEEEVKPGWLEDVLHQYSWDEDQSEFLAGSEVAE